MSIKLMSSAWDIDLPSGEKLILISLCDNSSDQGSCYPSIYTIARRCGMSERTVFNHLSSLEYRGYIVRHSRDGRSTLYEITLDSTPANSAPTPANSAPTPANSAPTPANSAPITITKPSLNHHLTKNSAAAFAVPDWICKNDWDLWIKTRKGKRLIPEQMQAQVDKLSRWRDDGLDYSKSLKDSAANGWQGLFEPKGSVQNNYRPSAKDAQLDCADQIFNRGRYAADRQIIEINERPAIQGDGTSVCEDVTFLRVSSPV